MTCACPASWSTTSWRSRTSGRPRRRPMIPAISGEVFKPISQSSASWSSAPARRSPAAWRRKSRPGWAVNLGFGVSANVPRIFIEEGLHGKATWVIEQGAVGGVPLLEFQFGCSSNAEAFVPSPYQFTYFQAARLRLLAALLPADRQPWLGECFEARRRPHVTAGAGGFVDITSRARKIVYLGLLQRRRPDGDRRRQAADREGRQGQETGEARWSRSPSPGGAA